VGWRVSLYFSKSICRGGVEKTREASASDRMNGKEGVVAFLHEQSLLVMKLGC
jgi:hypothetical protein